MPSSKKFVKLQRAVSRFYTGKKVPKIYQKRYGKRYSANEARSIAFAIARKKGWKV